MFHKSSIHKKSHPIGWLQSIFLNIPSSLPVANRYDFNNSWNNIHVSHFNGKFKISFLINKQSSQNYNHNISNRCTTLYFENE